MKPVKKPLFLLVGLCLLIGTALYLHRSPNTTPKTPKPPAYLVGSYHWGHWWMGGSLHLIEDGTYTTSSHSDVQSPQETKKHELERSDSDTFEVENERIKLLSWKKGEPTTEVIYYSVPWDKRIYLIKDDQFGEFVDAIRSGKEPCNPIRDNDFMVRGKDSDGVPKGLPQFPQEWRHMLSGVKRH